jgi:hypothetical protein
MEQKETEECLKKYVAIECFFFFFLFLHTFCCGTMMPIFEFSSDKRDRFLIFEEGVTET